MVFFVHNCLYCKDISIKTQHKYCRELHQWTNEHTHHMNTHHGGLEKGGIFFPALQGLSLQQRVGVGKQSEVEMWINQHGGKILGLLASVCFLLISHLVVLHVKLTTTLHSRVTVQSCLQHDSKKVFHLLVRGRISRNKKSTHWGGCHLTWLKIYIIYDVA